jgi:hypothetical protein
LKGGASIFAQTQSVLKKHGKEKRWRGLLWSIRSVSLLKRCFYEKGFDLREERE